MKPILYQIIENHFFEKIFFRYNSMSNILAPIQEVDRETIRQRDLFKILLLVFIIFSCVFSVTIWSFLHDYRHLPVFAYLLGLLLTLMPVVCFSLFAFKSKMGWALNVTMYLFFSVLLISGLIKSLIIGEYMGIKKFLDLERILLLALAVFSTILLLTKPIKLYLKIRRKIFITTLIIAGFVSLVLVPVFIN